MDQFKNHQDRPVSGQATGALSHEELRALRRGFVVGGNKAPSKLRSGLRPAAISPVNRPISNGNIGSAYYGNSGSISTSFGGPQQELSHTNPTSGRSPRLLRDIARARASPTHREQQHNGTHESRFPDSALEPKVQIPYENPPGKVPRKIEIERRKRLYASLDVEQCLRDVGIDYSQPNQELYHSYLPLYAFDDEEFDPRTQQEWMELGMDGGQFKYIPAVALYTNADNTSSWKDCKVIGYDEKENRYQVEWEDSTKQTWLPRINIMFRAEDPREFAKRVAAAHKARKEAESLLRYNLYVDSMPTDEIPPLEEERNARIRSLSLNTPKLRAAEPTLSVGQLLKDIASEYARTMNKIIFDTNLKDPTQQDIFSNLSLPAEPPKKPVPWSGLVSIPEYSYEATQSSFHFHTYYNHNEVIAALQKTREECLNILDNCKIFAIPIKKPVGLEEFDQMQNQAIERVDTTLNEVWVQNLKNHIKSSMKGVGKGWLNIEEKSRDSYEKGKLKRFMTTVKFIMEDSLRFLIEGALEKYVEFVSEKCNCVVVVKGQSEVEVSFPGPPRDYLSKSPLFRVELCQKENFFQYSTEIEKFSETILGLFDKAIATFQDIPQIEAAVMDQFFWNQIPVLSTVHYEERKVVEWRKRLKEAVEHSLVPLREYLKTYDEYNDLLQQKTSEYIQKYEEEQHSLEETKQEVLKHMNRKDEITKKIPSTIDVGAFVVECQQVRTMLVKKCQELAKSVLNLLAKNAKAKSTYVRESFSKISSAISRRPKTIEELVKIKEYIETVPATVVELQTSIDEMKVYYDILDDFSYSLSDDDFKQEWVAIGWPSKLEEQIEAAKAVLEKDKERFAETMAAEQAQFAKELEKLAKHVAGFSKHTDLTKCAEVASNVKRLQMQLKECEDKVKLFNSREALFDTKRTDYVQLTKIIKDFEPYANLWITCNDWLNWHQSWTTDPFENLDPIQMEKDVTNSYRIMHKSVRIFKENPAILKIVDEIKDQIEQFKPHLPLITALRNPGMRERHWKAISSSIGFELYPGKTLMTLEDMFTMNLNEHESEILKVCDVAAKEYGIEKALDKMEAEWKNVYFEIIPYRETGTYVMKGSDEISQQLDDHIVMTQSLSFHPFKKEFEERITKWEENLRLVSEVIEEWLLCQRQWLYLEPIFSSEDIMKQLPAEGKRFQTVNGKWRKTMAQAKQNPHAMTFIVTTSKLLETFQECNRLLDVVQKGLNKYLETKRQAFARFYFLSNDELLSILSQTKDPKAVQPHLRKCFEAIHTIHFEDDNKMTRMYSGEGESVPFAEGVYPKSGVEIWMGKIESMMKQSIKQQIKEAVIDYTQTPRTEWVLRWPGQIVLVGSQIFWTKEVAKALESGGNKALQAYHAVLEQQLLALTDVVRGPVSKLNRITLGALLTIDVHARDVVETMIKEKVESVNDFEWISQLRYYWENDECIVKQLETSFVYGYEYLGNTSRLVITPLTDRIYLTLTGALHLHLGGAPAGPAGTGKTETVKDLAKALAKQCVVFNCQEGLDYIAMGKFFKGLVMAGAWACFDEFNRIDVEVLSVVAQQITTMHQAINEGAETIDFEGTTLTVDPTFAVFITMNPGYAGRTELPDNLKAQFRPVACMVPDYALIGEIRMFSFGFRNAKALARKMVATFRLSSEQLSSQDHYDFGMRAVNTVISAAGLLKRENPTMDEELLLLRALRDSNLPKFLENDIILFNGIISDLFPGVKPPVVDYGELMDSLQKVTVEMGLQPIPTFLMKCIQLYETTVLRHGLMLVGPTGSGKTTSYRVLAKAMSAIKDNPKFTRVETDVCNPKSITMGQLYGQFDESTHEWTDGILATLFRNATYDTSGARRWVIFDGPVDALWIESMNTVLDENKKLCLVSGEIITMSSLMNIIFEVEDLAVASPATVSRCGMIYMEPSTCVGLEALVTSWLQALPDVLKPQVPTLQKLFDRFMNPTVNFVRRNLKEYVPSVNNNLVRSCLNMLDCFFVDYVPTENSPVPQEKLDLIPHLIEPLFIFSVIWSIGASCDREGRRKFDEFLRQEMKNANVQPDFPEKGLLYDYSYDQENKTWVHWMKTIPEFHLDPKTKFSDIIIPTTDSIRYTWLIQHLSSQGKHVLCIGPTGTGKTLNIQDKLMNGMPDQYIPMFITFSAQTSANMTQDILDSKFEKKRKGVYGPPTGKKFIIFVDDMNMPAREQYGAQPPIELLRQWMDHKGWYDRKSVGLPFMKIVDISFIGAMGPPGGGRNPVTNRFLRHFNFISFPEMEDDSLRNIFSTILKTFICNNFPEDIHSIITPMVESSISVFNTIVQLLLPTPTKSHYTFNLRDLAKVFQGVLSAEPKRITASTDLIRLWCHECARVFRDRLINNEDRKWFDDLLKKSVKQYFDLEWRDVVKSERLIYGDFMVPDADPRIYDEIKDMKQLTAVVEDYLDSYNVQTNKPMKLVMFLDAIEHVSRICRVLRQPMGNALLLGIGGSGRQSLTRLATKMCDYQLFQIEIAKGYGMTEWREDLKKVLTTAGLEGKPIVFLFTDTQIVSERQLEDINNILNSGEVPNLFEPTDLDNIMNEMRPICQNEGLQLTKITLYARFVKRVRENIHIVLAMSPLGEAFRNRLRMFPSLVTCCTIDWFSEWPEEALRSVARNTFETVDFGSEEIKTGVIDMCVHIHQSVEKASRSYLEEVRRYNYVTPTSYLELLTTVLKLQQEKKQELAVQVKRLSVGLDKIISTEAKVKDLQENLQSKKPILIQTTKDLEMMMVQLAKDKEAADTTRQDAEREEAAALEQEKECRSIKESAEADLAAAIPALESSLNALKLLNQKEISEVARYANPTAGVKLVMKAVCILMNVKPKMVGEAGKKTEDYWEPAKKLLNNPKEFMDAMLNFDKDNIPKAIIDKITPFMDMDDFQPKKVEASSRACTAMCKWVRAMHQYHFVALAVAPKRAALAEAEQQLEVTTKKLNETKAKLKEVVDKIQELERKYAESLQTKEKYEAEVEECTIKLDRASRLLGGLGGEKHRWTETVAALRASEHNLIGDVLVSAGGVAYLGAFTAPYRRDLYADWRAKLDTLSIPHSENCNIISTLSDQVQIRAWSICGLPTDYISIENAIIMSKARRWPLMIDPQGQANKWIKNMEKDNNCKIIKMSDKDFLRTLENAVQFGNPVLLENVGEELDPALEPVLLKQTFLVNGSKMIKLGENTIAYHDDFRFYMTTKLRNPHYSPETSVKVTLLNFFITQSGLEDQLLGIVVAKEREDLEQMKNRLVVNNAKMRKELKEIEDTILKMLSESTGDILDDEKLIETLSLSKKASKDIEEKVEEAERTEKEIDATRNKYRPVAFRSSILFFCVSDMALVDPMYQYSLQWFINLFNQGIENAEPSEILEDRLKNLNEYFTYSLFKNVCRSLFEEHKLLFSFTLCIGILKGDNLIDPLEWRFLLAGSVEVDKSIDNPAPAWLTEQSWSSILNLAKLPHFKGFEHDFIKNVNRFKQIFESSTAHREELPGIWNAKCNLFQKMLVTLCLRPDKVTEAVQDFVAHHLGQRFIEPLSFDLGASYKDSSSTDPLIFILSPGADPTAELFKFAEEMRFSKKLSSVSLGQGQGDYAERLINEGMEKGTWVLLQNCHLAVSWMPALERIVENIPPTVHRDFRLWLTSMPSSKFPVSVLQNGVKMTNEPPKGLKANLLRSYRSFDPNFLDTCKKPFEFKKLLFGLCFFHAIIQERRKFGPLGWNIRYEFTTGDLNVCVKQLSLFLDKYDHVPYKVLEFLTGQINYGGRVTDDWDRRTLMTILKTFICPDVLSDDYKFSPSGKYMSIPAGTIKDYIDYLSGLAINAHPEVFGLHENADITCARAETYTMINTIISLQPRVSTGVGKSREAIIEEIATDIQKRVQDPWPIHDIMEKYPTVYEESMNTVLVQEVIRYNKLLAIIKQSLVDILKALKGLVVMSGQLEQMGNSLYNNQVPQLWADRAYPSLKPLSSWVADLIERLRFIDNWIKNGIPTVFWISGFFFPQAFLTGTLQNYARKTAVSIDTVSFAFTVMKQTEDELKEKPGDGCYIRGLFLEGARWDPEAYSLTESRSKELFTDMPIIWLKPETNRQKPESGYYDCPVYKTLTRAGTLSTTGHSTNYVLTIEVPSNKPQEHWIKRGVALICSLDV